MATKKKKAKKEVKKIEYMTVATLVDKMHEIDSNFCSIRITGNTKRNKYIEFEMLYNQTPSVCCRYCGETDRLILEKTSGKTVDEAINQAVTNLLGTCGED